MVWSSSAAELFRVVYFSTYQMAVRSHRPSVRLVFKARWNTLTKIQKQYIFSGRKDSSVICFELGYFTRHHLCRYQNSSFWLCNWKRRSRNDEYRLIFYITGASGDRCLSLLTVIVGCRVDDWVLTFTRTIVESNNACPLWADPQQHPLDRLARAGLAKYLWCPRSCDDSAFLSLSCNPNTDRSFLALHLQDCPTSY
ncbi:hypothetical protein BDW66DRAFT_10497 [Aspergillus desertorum]